METLPGAALKWQSKPAHSTKQYVRWAPGVPWYCCALASNFGIRGSYWHKDLNLLYWVFWASARLAFKPSVCLHNAVFQSWQSPYRGSPCTPVSSDLLQTVCPSALFGSSPVCFPSCDPAFLPHTYGQVLPTSASHEHSHFSSTPRVPPCSFVSPKPGLSSTARYPPIINLQFLHSLFSHSSLSLQRKH